MPDAIPGLVHRRIALRPQPVCLDAQGIDREHDAMPAILKGIKGHLNVVVVVDVLAPADVRSNLVRRRVQADPDEVQFRIVIAEIDPGLLGSGSAVAGQLLDEAGDFQRLSGALRRRHAAEVLDSRRGSQSWDPNSRRRLDGLLSGERGGRDE